MIKSIFIKILLETIRCIIIIIAYTPLRILYAISSMVAFALLHLKAPNRITQRNIRRAFSTTDKTKVKNITYKYYEAFGDYLFEFIKQSRFSDDEMQKRCKFTNLSTLEKMFEKNKLVICYCGHMLNFEWFVSLPLHLPQYEMGHIYLSGEINKLTSWVLNLRGRYGAVNIPSNSPLRYLQKVNREMELGTYHKQGFIYGTLADMDTSSENPHVSCFFDHDMEMLTGSERIGRKYNMTFVYANIKRPKRGYYEVEFIPMTPADIDTNEYAYTDEFVRLLEKNIRKQPELWMLWGEARF